MQKIILPIDTKSLYYNIKNDNASGHTATVATPIKQGNSINEQLNQIYKIPNQVDFQSKPDLINQLVKNSKSQIIITNTFIFNKISVNGNMIECDNKYFCIYIKEEVDPEKAQFGRIKMHYPISLKYDDEDLEIDNRFIINQISKQLNDYAFIVNSFEYDFDESVLNFKVNIVGENQIPYSKVFLNNKGVGNKYTSIFNEMADSYDMEIISLRKLYDDGVDPENYNLYFMKHQEKAYDLIKNYLNDMNYKNINSLGEVYPYSLYDIDYEDNGKTKYLQIYFTVTSNKYFNISSKRLQFLNDFSQNTKIILISSIVDNPVIDFYELSDVLSFSKSINSMMIKIGD